MSAEFEHSFLELPENRFAKTAVERLLTADPNFHPRLVYLSGPPGTGKSHLAISETRKFIETFEDVHYRLLPLYEYSTWNMEAASQRGGEVELDHLRTLDLLVCEDLHQIEKTGWLQKKLLLLIDELLAQGSRILITSQIPIGEFSEGNPKLLNRCHAGITTSIAAPCHKSRLSLLHHFAAQRNLFLPTAAAEDIATQFPVSPRELQGLILQLEAIHHIQESEITVEFVHHFLQQQTNQQQPSLSEIARAVSREFNVTVQAIRSETRERSLLVPRQIAMWLSRELTEAKFAEIGKYYGGRSHSTVMHACQTLADKVEESPELESQVQHLRKSIQASPGKPV